MDIINTANWNNYFDNSQQQVLFASDRYTEYAISFNDVRLLGGTMKTIVSPGMMFGELNLQSDRPFRLVDSESKESAESVFVLQGDVESRFYNLKNPLQFSRHKHNLQYNTNFAGEHTIHAGGFMAVTLTYDLDYLKTLVLADTDGSLGSLNRSLHKKTNFLATSHSLLWQSRMAEIIHTIRHCVFTGLAKYIFIESKMLELFVLQMDQIFQSNGARTTDKWIKTDQEKLYAVKDFLEKAYLEPLSLKEITCKFGLNEFKLKKGYRHFFQKTVFGHIHELRMQHAKSLLANRQMNVTEVAYFIGYNNVSSFSCEFKKRYGCCPGAYRN